MLSASIQRQPVAVAGPRETIAKAILAHDEAPLDAYQQLAKLPTSVLGPELRSTATLSQAYSHVMHLICAEVFPVCDIHVVLTDELDVVPQQHRRTSHEIPHLSGKHAFEEARARSTDVRAHCGVVSCYTFNTEWEFPERTWAWMYQQCHALAIDIGRIHIAEEPNHRLVNLEYEQCGDRATLIMTVFGEE